MSPKPTTKRLTAEDFTNQSGVVDAIDALKKQFGEHFEQLNVSDTIDEDGHQYVHLVQKGGGVLGIALVGYTYVLETAGIRFLRLAGTSAGAINTGLMTVIGNKKDAKSTTIIQYLADMDFFSFVDGHPFARWLIKSFVTNADFSAQLTRRLSQVVWSLLALFIADTLLTGLGHYYPLAAKLAPWCYVLTGLNVLLIVLLLTYAGYLFGRLKACGYGINPGHVFYDWIRERLADNGVVTVTDLKAKAAQRPDLRLKPRAGSANTPDSLFGDVTFITSELVSENKVELPRMCNLFRARVDELQPAGFIRASMSIPLFFESYVVNNIQANDPAISAAWMEYFRLEKDAIPSTARFVDGGMLSNFPINLFYNPKVVEPRLPVFGIDLDDSAPVAPSASDPLGWDLASYIWRLFNTIRYYYDKDFLEKNFVFQKGVGSIKLAGYNWLNFFLSDKDKMAMFLRGAEAATDFLKTFDWEDYRRARIEMQTEIINKSK